MNTMIQDAEQKRRHAQLRDLFTKDQAEDIVAGLDMLKADTEKRATRRKWRQSELTMVLGGIEMTRSAFLRAWPELTVPAQTDIEQTAAGSTSANRDSQ